MLSTSSPRCHWTTIATVSLSSTQWRCSPPWPWKERSRSKGVNDWISLGWMWFKAVMGKLRLLCCTLSCGVTAEGKPRAIMYRFPASGSCVVSHMLAVITSRYVILPAGRSWQSEKPCMKFYQLVNTSGVIIPLCIGVVTWLDFFFIFWAW